MFVADIEELMTNASAGISRYLTRRDHLNFRCRLHSLQCVDVPTPIVMRILVREPPSLATLLHSADHSHDESGSYPYPGIQWITEQSPGHSLPDPRTKDTARTSNTWVFPRSPAWYNRLWVEREGNKVSKTICKTHSKF